MFWLYLLTILLLKSTVAAVDKQNILNGLEDLKRNVVSLRKQVINDTIISPSTLELEISKAVQMDPLVILHSEKLDTARENGDPVGECQQIFDTKYELVLDKLQKYVSNKINNELGKVLNSLKSIEKNTDDFISTIKKGQPSQSDIDKIIDGSDKDFHTVERLKYVLKVIEQNTLYDLDKAPASDIVKDDLLKPTFKCLENSKVTEYKKI